MESPQLGEANCKSNTKNCETEIVKKRVQLCEHFVLYVTRESSMVQGILFAV